MKLYIIRYQLSFPTVVPDLKAGHPRVTHPSATKWESKSEIVQALNLQWATSFDLHVLGMPPAFILSQDQTLQKKYFLKLKLFVLTNCELTFCSVFKDHSLLFTRSNSIIPNKKIIVNTFFDFLLFFYLTCSPFKRHDTNITNQKNNVNTFFQFFCFFIYYIAQFFQLPI